MRRIENTLYDILDQYTGEAAAYQKISTHADGASMNDAKCDGVMYRKIGTEYFKRSLSEPVSPEMFGALGFPNDDTVALQKFLNVNDTYKLQFSRKKYMVSSTLYLNHGNIEIEGNGAEIVASAGFSDSSYIMQLNGLPIKTSNTSVVEVVRGISQVTLTSVTNISVGDLIELAGGFNHNYNGVTYNYGHIAEIKSISGNVVTLSVTPSETFSTSTVKTYSLLKNIAINDLTLNTDSTTAWGINCNKIANLDLSRFKIRGNSGVSEVGGLISACLDVTISRSYVEGFSKVGTTQQLGYGWAVSGHNITIIGSILNDCKHCIAGGSRAFLSTGLKYLRNNIIGADVTNGTPLDFHGNCRGIAQGNTIYSIKDTGAINVRDGGIDIIDNDIYITREGTGESVRAIYFGEMFWGGCKIENNRVHFKTTTRPTKLNVIEMNTPAEVRVSNMQISGNTSNNGGYAMKRCDSDVIIKDNILNNEDGQQSGFPGIIATDSKLIVAKNNTFRNNYGAVFNYTMQIDADSRAEFYENKIYRISANTSPTVRINSLKNKVYDNEIFLDTGIGGGGIVDYTVEKENLIYNNNRVTSTGTKSILAITALPTATDFFLGSTIQVLNGSVVEYWFMERESGVYTWKRPVGKSSLDNYIASNNQAVSDIVGKSMMQQPAIGNTDNLNTMLSYGTFTRGSSTGNTVALGYPYENASGGTLLVLAGVSGNALTQMYITRENRIFYRTYFSTFTGWEEVMKVSNYAGSDVTTPATTASPTKTTLNASLGTKKANYMRYYPYLTDGPRIYTKLTDSDTSDWVWVPMTIVL